MVYNVVTKLAKLCLCTATVKINGVACCSGQWSTKWKTCSPCNLYVRPSQRKQQQRARKRASSASRASPRSSLTSLTSSQDCSLPPFHCNVQRATCNALDLISTTFNHRFRTLYPTHDAINWLSPRPRPRVSESCIAFGFVFVFVFRVSSASPRFPTWIILTKFLDPFHAFTTYKA